MEYLCENADVKEITILAKKIIEPSEMYVDMMLQMNHGWDSDLLREVVEVLK